jgi:hypothetical protein
MQTIIDLGAPWVTLLWLVLLLAWPGAALVGAVGWFGAALACARRASHRAAIGCALLATLVLADAIIVLFALDFALLAALPSHARPLAQVTMIFLPWLAVFSGAIGLLLALRRAAHAVTHPAEQITRFAG